MSDIDELFETLTNLQRSKRLPPLHLWQPEHEGVIDIRIDREGAWYHEGARIQRQPLVDLFATILRREGDDYFLVTPAEKMKIAVEEAPFIAIDLDVRGVGAAKQLLFSTNVGDYVVADQDHRLSCAMVDRFCRLEMGWKPEFSAVFFTGWWKKENSRPTTCSCTAMAVGSTWDR
jgi:hypothetical protein